MKILVIDSFCRVRDLKTMFSMKKVYGNKIQFVLAKTTPRQDNIKLIPGLKVENINSNKNPVGQIHKLCRKHNIDILHTHNYPDTYGHWGIQVKKKRKIPVIHECHDIGYNEASPSNKQLSNIVMKNVDRIISVSNSMTSYLHKNYGVKKKCTTIYSYPNKDFLPRCPNKVQVKYINGVYEGGINNAYVPNSQYNHRYYFNIFKSLSNQGLKIDVYPARNVTHGYAIKNIKFRNNIPDIKNLYKTISRYDFGFVGYNPTGSPILDMAAPNKIFEFIASGIPVLAHDYVTIRSFIRQTGLGVIIPKGNSKLPTDYHSKMLTAKKKVLQVARSNKYTMEKQAGKLFRLYEGVL